jgi:hypothetical protein
VEAEEGELEASEFARGPEERLEAGGEVEATKGRAEGVEIGWVAVWGIARTGALSAPLEATETADA